LPRTRNTRCVPLWSYFPSASSARFACGDPYTATRLTWTKTTWLVPSGRQGTATRCGCCRGARAARRWCRFGAFLVRLCVTVVLVEVVPVDADEDPVLDVSGVVVVIVVTTVLLPVVIVDVMVVVACAPNGAAPAVNAAVAAPRAIRTAKAAPQMASFRYLLVM